MSYSRPISTWAVPKYSLHILFLRKRKELKILLFVLNSGDVEIFGEQITNAPQIL